MAEPVTNSRVAIITMVRRSEFPAAWSSFATVEPNLRSNRRHIVLLNDDRDSTLEEQIATRPNTELITPGSNVGVAKGRNALILAALEWGADYIASVDDDLILPIDYVDRMVEQMVNLTAKGERVGVVAPAIIDFHAYAAASMSKEDKRNARRGELVYTPTTSELKEQIRRTWTASPSSYVYHLGIRDWHRHYLTIRNPVADRVRAIAVDVVAADSLVRSPADEPTELRRDGIALEAVRQDNADAIGVDGLPGGACMYARELVEGIGLTDAAFSPFGYEDADFSIRSIKAGFRNFLLPSEVVLHDLDSRGKSRDITSLLYVQGRSRALIGRRNLGRKAFTRLLTEAVVLGPFLVRQLSSDTRQTENAPLASFLAGLTGWTAGWVRGLFAENAVTSSGLPEPGPRLTVPVQRSFVSRTTIPIKPSSKAALPREIPVTVKLAYSFDRAAGTIDIDRFEFDSPGLGTVVIQGRLSGVGSEEDLEPGRCRLDRLKVAISDEGFIGRLNRTVAEQRGIRNADYLSPFAKSVRSDAGNTIRSFLRGDGGRRALHITINPDTPVAMEDLLRFTSNSRKAGELLGLRIEVTEL